MASKKKAKEKPKKMTPKEQSAQFIKTARELECDESERNFDEKLRRLLSKA